MNQASCLAALIALTLLVPAVLAQDTGSDPTVPWIMEARTGKQVELKALIEELADHDVIVLGEQHDNDSGHEFQLSVIKGLVEKGLDVVVSTEQFERDVQGALDDYLAGRITEDEFVAKSRPWKNYAEHYRPIIEFAKANHLPVLAGNVPGSVASSFSKGEPVSAAQRVFLPRSTTTPEDDYWKNFEATMKGHIGNDGDAKLKQFYAAQCVKDDAMAETITDYLAANSHRPKTVVHLCGHFHSDYGLGTVARIVQRKPLAKITVVTMESIPDADKPDPKPTADRAHYIFWTAANPSANKK